jgi:hypothetical protein
MRKKKAKIKEKWEFLEEYLKARNRMKNEFVWRTEMEKDNVWTRFAKKATN